MKKLTKLFLLAAVSGLMLSTVSASSAADSTLLYGNQWLNGEGVDVMVGSDVRQCVELVNRLYLARRWISSTWYGNGNTLKDHLPKGLSYEPNGSISYLNPGDVVTLNGGTYGHAAIVNTVFGSAVSFVNQNTQSVYGKSTYSNKSLTSWLSGYSVQGVIHAPVDRLAGGNLYFIKTKNPESGHVEIHTATQASSYQSGQDFATYFSVLDADNGWFQMVGSNLYFIKTKNTGSLFVELHSATASSDYQSGIHLLTPFRTKDADNGWFQIDDVDRDGAPDLAFIKTRNTGTGKVEFFVAEGSDSYSTVSTAIATAFSPLDADNGWFQAQGPDLVFVKTRNTASGKVEYQKATGASSYQRITASASAFNTYDQNNGWFSSEDPKNNSHADLFFVKTHNPGTGRVELFDASQASAYQQIITAIASRFSPGEADNGWFQIGSKQ